MYIIGHKEFTMFPMLCFCHALFYRVFINSLILQEPCLLYTIFFTGSPWSLSHPGVFVQQLAQANHNENIVLALLWEFCGFPLKDKWWVKHFHVMMPSWDHYNDVIMSALASQITSLTIVYSTIYSDADQRKHQSSASLAFAQGIHQWPANSPHKGPATIKMFPFDDIIM